VNFKESTGRFTQHYYPNGNLGATAMYFRHWYSGYGWTAWQQVITDKGGTMKGALNMGANDITDINFLTIGHAGSRSDDLRFKWVRSGSTGDLELRLYNAHGATLQDYLLKISTAGMMVQPKRTLIFSARNTTNASVAANTYVRIPFNFVDAAKSNNRGSSFNTTTGEFTAPSDGEYKVDIGVLITGMAAGGIAVFHLYHNGVNLAELARVATHNTAGIQGSGGLSLHLSAGDKLDIRVHSGASAASVLVGSYFTIAQL
jgi:C1q domain